MSKIIEKTKEVGRSVLDWFKNKSLRWLKDNWFIILAFVAIVFLFWRGCSHEDSYSNLYEKYQEQTQEHQKQIKELQQLQQKERKELDEQLQHYQNELNRIEQEYKEKLNRIARLKENRRTDILREHEEDPESLTKTINEVFGIPVEE